LLIRRHKQKLQADKPAEEVKNVTKKVTKKKEDTKENGE